MRNLCAVVLATALVTSSAFAASNTGLLAPGKPAGVAQAQSGSQVALIVAGTAAFAMIAALVSGSGGGASGGSNPNGGGGGGTTGGTTTTTTTST